MKLCLSFFALFTLMLTVPAARAAVDFDKQVLPIFTANCTKCHGEKKHMGKLSLHSAEAIKEKLADEEDLIVAGKPESSELYERSGIARRQQEANAKGGRSS